MNIADLEYLEQNLDTTDLQGSDSSLGNIFLLQPKYNTSIKIQNNYFFRHYFGKKNRFGYAFPLKIKANPNNSTNSLSDAISLIFEQNDSKTDINFCLCTQNQKNELDKCFLEYFPDYKIDWKTNRDDCDYIYLQEKLSTLSGSALQKKKNHISRFLRNFENQWEFKLFPENNIADDILKVEEEWYSEREKTKNDFSNEELLLEKESIKIALENAATFKLTGGVIYIKGKPVAMTLASPVSDSVLDIHFEKVLYDVAQFGGYAAINNFFVKTCTNYKYINREEDVGVEGLRKAKLSYKPEILLDKFYGKVVKC